MNHFSLLTKDNLWILNSAISLIILALLIFMASLIRDKIAKKTEQSWKKRIIERSFMPFILFICTLVFGYIFHQINQRFSVPLLQSYFDPLRNSLLVISFVLLIFRFKAEFQAHLYKRIVLKKKMLRSTFEFIGKMVSIVIFFISLLFVLQILGINIMPLVAFGGVGAAALGFAAKDVIANFFSGFMLHITRPFHIGDYVELPHSSINGIVEDIGWYLTCIKDLEKTPIYVPNNMFSTALIRNFTRRTHRRIEEALSVRYEDIDQLPKVLSEIKAYLAKHPGIDQNESIYVNFSSYKDYFLEFILKAYTVASDYAGFMKVKEEVLFEVHQILKRHGADFPFPTTTVLLENKP
ncbi:MAG TPA: mechanosensitive ion channel family protein [Chlamydiales bacterium]|nr:mechanosensitive ion channel family protein [Chlamydiales bacterium]